MRSIQIFFLVVLLSFSLRAYAAPMNANVGHLYWAFGPNLTPTGNLRLGFNSIEVGLLQSTGLGVVFVQRSPTPIFVQLGAVTSGSAVGLIGGGGLEWNNYSWFRFRTDITVSTDSEYQTKSVVTFGGVFIL